MTTDISKKGFRHPDLTHRIGKIIAYSRERDGSHFYNFDYGREAAEFLGIVCGEPDTMKRSEYNNNPNDSTNFMNTVYPVDLDRAKEILKGLENLPEHSLEGTKTYTYSELLEVLAEQAI